MTVLEQMKADARACNAAARRTWDGSNAPIAPPKRKPDPARIAEYRRHADNGLSQVATAKMMGVTRTAVSKASKRYGIVFVPGHSFGKSNGQREQPDRRAE